MGFSPEQLVNVGAGHLAAAGLATAPVWSGFRRLHVALPPIFTIGTFECRLDDDDRVDFQACAPRREGAHPVIHEWLARQGETDFPSRGHRSTAALLREWVDPHSSFGSDIAAVWVEIDIEEGGAAPWPFPFFTLTPPWMRSEARPPERTAALVDAGLDVLTGGDLDPRTHTAVHRCLQAMPPQASLFHVAMRPMPGGDVVRLIAGTPWELVPDFLAQLDWPEPVETLRRFLQRYCQDTLINSIQLDLGHQLGPRLGLELYFPTPPEDPRWQRLFDLLITDGACSAEKRDSVCSWPMREANAEQVLRELLVKVVYEVGKPLRAKAYLPYGQADALAAPARQPA